MQNPLDIGRRLAALRRTLGVSQRELAVEVGTTQQQVARWESTSYRSASLTSVASVVLALTSRNEFVAAESAVEYATRLPRETELGHGVRDAGEVAARLRAHGTELRDRYHFHRIGVFGSFANGTQTERSDVDLLVETDDPGGIRFVDAVLFLEELLGRRVDLVREHLVRGEIRDRVMREVIYVWTAQSGVVAR